MTTQPDIETPPPAMSYRVRMINNQWVVRLYADTTLGDWVGTTGPYASLIEAEDAGKATGLINGDSGI